MKRNMLELSFQIGLTQKIKMRIGLSNIVVHFSTKNFYKTIYY